MKTLRNGLAILMAATIPTAMADTGFYLGASAGSATLDGTLPATSTTFSESDTAFKAFAGYRLLDLLAVEASYLDFGKPSAAGTSVNLSGWDLMGVANLPLGPVGIFVKGGLIQWDMETTSGTVSQRDDGNHLALGAGVSFRMMGFGVRAEYERFDLGSQPDASLISVGAEYSF